MERVTGYVLNDYLKFEKKLYNLMGWRIGREIPVKSVLYTLVFGAILAVLWHIPLIGWPLHLLPPAYLVGIPVLGAWLLTDVGTEQRPPVDFFKSLVRYHWMKIKGDTYYKGQVMAKPKPVAFAKGYQVNLPKPPKPIAEPAPLQFRKGYDVHEEQTRLLPDGQLISPHEQHGKRKDPGALRPARLRKGLDAVPVHEEIL